LIYRQVRHWVPVWAWYPDPGYQYLLAGGQIVTGGTPHHNDHPGTSAQWIIGLVEFFTHVFVGNDSLRFDLIARPEFYAQVVGVTLAALYIAALVFCGIRVLRAMGLVPSLVLQMILLWGLPIMDVGRYRLMPETIALSAAIATVGVLAPRLAASERRLSTQGILALGILTAIGLTSKILFVPLAVVTLIVLNRRELVHFILISVVSCAVILIPVYSRFDYMRTWFLGILINPGRQGQPGEPTDTLQSVSQSLVMLNLSVRWFVPVSLIIISTTWASVFVYRRVTGRWQWRSQLALTVGLILVLAASTKEAEMRDFLLAFPILAAMSALGIFLIVNCLRSRLWKAFFAIAFTAPTTLLALHGSVGSDYNFQATVDRTGQITSSIDALEATTSSGRWGLGYNVWTQANAVLFALPWLNGAYGVEARSQIPEDLYFDIWSRVFIGTTESGEVRVLGCQETQRLLESEELGVIVETPNHLEFDSMGTSILLKNGLARIRELSNIGPYTAYTFTEIICSPGGGNDS